MIPEFTQSGVLPPFYPHLSPDKDGAMAPYRVGIADVATRFVTSLNRKEVFSGLLDYRSELRSAGFTQGFQWIGGSFVEDCEAIRSRPPQDLDVVTFARRLDGYSPDEWRSFTNGNPLFRPRAIKAKHKCDAYFVDLSLPAETVVAYTRYWFGLFSHQRATAIWKGLIEVSLGEDDLAARQLIDGGSNAS
ncbi:DUF6932 family protein [Candidatus Nitrospira bockiana]